MILFGGGVAQEDSPISFQNHAFLSSMNMQSRLDGWLTFSSRLLESLQGTKVMSRKASKVRQRGR